MLWIVGILFLAACVTRRQSITNEQGTFYLKRAQGAPDESGAYAVELWEKDGQEYYRRTMANGDSYFTRSL